MSAKDAFRESAYLRKSKGIDMERITEIEERLSAIAAELDTPEADLDALEEEVRALKAEKQEIEEKAEKRAALLEEVEVRGVVVETFEPEIRNEEKMETVEIRNSKAYIDAYAEYLKTGDDKECRALLSENVSGTVAVPEVVYELTKNAWERDEIARRVRKAYAKGNLKVGFEISADGAIVHTEGTSAISPENLVLGIIELVPQSIKKALQVSDEALDLRGEEFLQYLIDEITYRISRKAVEVLIDKISALTTVATTTAVSVGMVTASTVSLGLVASAMAELADEAAEPIVVMNKATWGAFKAAQAAGNFGYDPFEGLPVAFNSHLPALAAATTGDTWAIVGDFGQGALFNFPNGEGVDITIDRMTYKKEDLVEIFGREYVGIGVVAPKAFTKIVLG